jgi:hypothetical protein
VRDGNETVAVGKIQSVDKLEKTANVLKQKRKVAKKHFK